MRQRFAKFVSRRIESGKLWWAGLTPEGRAKAKRLSILTPLVALLFIGGVYLANRALTSEPPVEEPEISSGAGNPLPPTSQPPVIGSQPTGGQPVASTPAQEKFTPYEVKRGEFIISIAIKLGVPWESIMVANEKDLAQRAAERCAKLPESYRKKPGRRGHYCNELVTIGGKPMVAPNSLQPGDVLQIPSITAPVAIQKAIENAKGDRIVVVIDETGSMAGDDGVDDRERVSSWYLQAVRNSGKQIVKVILFAEGHIRELESTGWNIQPRGGYENTRAALERAATHRPDAIVLLTDEPGQDWRGFQNLNLPPVIAHSLHSSADANLAYVARLTGGAFLRSHTGPIALSVR